MLLVVVVVAAVSVNAVKRSTILRLWYDISMLWYDLLVLMWNVPLIKAHQTAQVSSNQLFVGVFDLFFSVLGLFLNNIDKLSGFGYVALCSLHFCYNKGVLAMGRQIFSMFFPSWVAFREYVISLWLRWWAKSLKQEKDVELLKC